MDIGALFFCVSFLLIMVWLIIKGSLSFLFSKGGCLIIITTIICAVILFLSKCAGGEKSNDVVSTVQNEQVYFWQQ